MAEHAPGATEFMAPQNTLEAIAIYRNALQKAYGRQHWWPAKTRFEVVAGAYLTQNTSWKNVEHALTNLRRARALSVPGIRNLSLGDLELLVRPSGYFRQKARNLKTFVSFLDDRYGGSLRRMFRQDTSALRKELLALNGVGPETADSILLYAGNHETFVVDVYTRRIVARHHLIPYDAPYDEVRQRFEEALQATAGEAEEGEKVDLASPPLPHSRAGKKQYSPSKMSAGSRSGLSQAYNELHALIVRVGSSHCRKQAQCDGCPLQPYLPAGEMRK